MALNRTTLSRMGAAAVVIGLAGAGYFFLQHSHRAKASAAAVALEEEVPVVAAVAEKKDVPLIVRGIGTVQAYNMVVIKTPRRRRHRQGVLQRRPGRQGGRSALPDRPAAVPGGARPGAGGQGTQRGAARERPARPQPLRHAQQGGLSVAPELRRADGDRARAARLRSPPTRRRSPTPSSISIYADIRAPFDGRTGTRLVDIGNLVQAAQPPPWSASPR